MSLPTSSYRQSPVSPRGLSQGPWQTPPTGKDGSGGSRSRDTARKQRSLVIEAAKSGDHAAIHHLLMSLLHGPTESEYQASLDHPQYHPSDRLLLRHGEALVGHIRMTPRLCRMGRAWLPTCELSEFAVLPEYRDHPQTAALLQTASLQAADAGAVLLTTPHDRPDNCHGAFWVPCGSSICWGAPPRDLLAQCADRFEENASDGQSGDARLHIRPWRYIEQQALCELYELNADGIDGAPHRAEDYWQWLLVRRGFDSILVATTDPAGESEGSCVSGQIVAYAFVRDGDIVELMASPTRPQAAVQLIQRVAADAIERDDHQVRVFGPSTGGALGSIMNCILPKRTDEDPLPRPRSHQLVRILDVTSFLKASWQSASRRRRSCPSDFRVGLKLDDVTLAVEVRDGTLRIVQEKVSRIQIQARGPGVTRLLLGQVDWDRLSGDPDIETSSASARRIGAKLFQPITLWRSTLDDLPSCK